MPKQIQVKLPKALLLSTLFLSALALSACATKPKEEPVAAPAPVEAVIEKPAAPMVEAVAAPAPAVITSQSAVAAEPAPKQIAPKARKKVVKAKSSPPKTAPPVVALPEPVVAPAPIVKQEAPAVSPPPAPTPPEIIAPPAKQIAEPGFLEQYWLWLLGIVIAGIGAWWLKSRKGKQQA